MKKSIGVVSVAVVLMASLLVSCTSSADDVENAEEELVDAQEKLDESNEKYKLDMKDYKATVAAQISANEKSIKDFNARIETQKSEAKAEYKKKIADLETKNSDMKKRMEDFKADGQSSWDLFKLEFSREMDALGTAFKNFTITDEK